MRIQYTLFYYFRFWLNRPNEKASPNVLKIKCNVDHLKLKKIKCAHARML